jgi:hypothetical protein
MAIREGMTNIVALIRQYGHVSTDDMTLGDIVYWTDEQLQDIADANSYRRLIAITPATFGNKTVYSLNIPRHYYAESTTLAAYTVTGETKVAVETLFTYDMRKAEVTFESDLSSTTKYYVEASFTNLYEALADLWGQKAVQRADYVAFKGGDNKMDMDQEYNHCLDREKHYRNLIIKRVPRGRSSKWSIS